jgi:methionyl-tRNA formyltransferase
MVASPVAVAAEQAGLAILAPRTPRDPEFLEVLRGLALDCVAVIAYGGLLPREALDIPRHGWVNLHFSLLPAWRGAAPVQHAILAGDDVTGATVFRIVEALDSGPVYGTMTYAIGGRATAGEVLADLSTTADRLMVGVLDAIEDGRACPTAQDGEVTLAPRLTSADGRVDWSEPWFAIDRRVRACTPAPGPWTTSRGRRLELGVLNGTDGGMDLRPGVLTAMKDAVWVGTGTSAVRLGQVRPAGKAWMDAAAWVRGLRPQPHETLGGGQ